MAHQLVPLYQLGAAVGKGAPNRSDDVRLIETLIETALQGVGKESLEVHARQQLNRAVPPKAPRITGIYSENLQEWINVLQSLFKKFKFVTATDGRIDPLPNDKLSSIDVHTRTSKGAEYMLFALIKLAINFGGPEAYMSIRDRAGMKFQATVGNQDFSF